MNRTSIAWVLGPDGKPGYTWNPALGCKAVSPGCAHCYAARLAGTRLAHLPQYRGLTHQPTANGKWTGEVRFFPEKLAEPLRLRKPAGIFVADMSDLFHDGLTNEQIAAVFGVMAACPQHRFYVLTKRPARMRAWFEWLSDRRNSGVMPHGMLAAEMAAPFLGAPLRRRDGSIVATEWPLPNVWLGTTVENQKAADERIPLLLQTPEAVRFLSVEPLLEKIDLAEWIRVIDHCSSCGAENESQEPDRCQKCGKEGTLVGTIGEAQADRYRSKERYDENSAAGRADLDGTGPAIDWVIVGGESGPKARPFNIEWARAIVRQCKSAGVPVFVKQMGARPLVAAEGCVTGYFQLRDRAGADMEEFPSDLRIRESP